MHGRLLLAPLAFRAHDCTQVGEAAPLARTLRCRAFLVLGQVALAPARGLLPRACRCDSGLVVQLEQVVKPTVSKQVKAASLEAARSSTCGGGWALSGWGFALGVPRCPEPPGAPREGAAGELERCEDGHFGGAAEREAERDDLRSKAVESAALQAGSLEPPRRWRGAQWPGPLPWAYPGRAELPGAARRALRRRRGRTRAVLV